MPFSSFELSSALLKAISKQNYTAPYPVQKEAIPAILKGKDILGIAPTGSGKTASYVLPILELFQKQKPSHNRHVNTLVLAPTRELAIQINEAFNTFGEYLPVKIKSMAVYGGVSINPQMIGLQGVEVLVATPGRLLELVSAKAVSISMIQILVVDEADKMLNLGFKEEMTRIFAQIPAMRQTLLYSATLSDDLNAFNQVLLRQPLVIKVEEEKNNIDLIEQTAYLISEVKKGPLLRYIIKNNSNQQALVFASSIYRADIIVDKLKANGIDARAIHSKKSQEARRIALDLFKSGKIKVLVATDLIARGIDIQNLPYVINYELPRSPKDYIHRIGRTGRAETPGEAISLITSEDEHHFKIIQKKTDKIATLIDGNAIDLQGY